MVYTHIYIQQYALGNVLDQRVYLTWYIYTYINCQVDIFDLD